MGVVVSLEQISIVLYHQAMAFKIVHEYYSIIKFANTSNSNAIDLNIFRYRIDKKKKKK
jgi:hypothetical protein